MAIDIERLATALATTEHPVTDVRPVVARYLPQSGYAQEYQDFQALDSFRKALATLPEPDRQRRAMSLVSCWDGSSDPDARTRFARVGFAQGIDYHQLADGQEPTLVGASFAPISWYDVDGLMGALNHLGGAGESLATCVELGCVD